MWELRATGIVKNGTTATWLRFPPSELSIASPPHRSYGKCVYVNTVGACTWKGRMRMSRMRRWGRARAWCARRAVPARRMRPQLPCARDARGPRRALRVARVLRGRALLAQVQHPRREDEVRTPAWNSGTLASAGWSVPRRAVCYTPVR